MYLIYCDGKEADYRTNPACYTITQKTVTNKTRLKLNTAESGGYAISIKSLN